MTFKKCVVNLMLLLQLTQGFAQNLVGTNLRLKPATLPITCNDGDIRFDIANSRAKYCSANLWTQFVDANSTVAYATAATTASFAGIAASAVTASSAGTAATAGIAASAVTASSAGTAATAGIAASAVTASSAGTAATAGIAASAVTASAAGTASTAALAALADIAKISTAFATTPAGCTSGQYAHHIAVAGTLTCSAVAFSELTGTASIALGGTNNGTLAVTNGGVIYTDGSKLMNTGVGTAGQVLTSNGAGAPTWQNSTAATIAATFTHYFGTNGYGSTNTAIRKWSVNATTTGTDFTVANDTAAGFSITIVNSGKYAFTYCDLFNTNEDGGLSINATGSELTTSVTSITAAKVLGILATYAADQPNCVSWSGHLTANTVIRPHTRLGTDSSVPNRGHFWASRID